MSNGVKSDPGAQVPGHVRVVIGLGNPGPQHALTRHNVGFMVVDRIADRLGLVWQRSGNAAWATVSGELNTLQGEPPGQELLLCKPQTFMNRSGELVEVLKKQGIKPEELLVVHDELEKPLGYVGMKFGGSAKGHNGLRSLMERWGSGDFWRLRVGIGRPEGAMDIGEYVLSMFPKDERLVIDVAVIKAAGMIASL